MGAHARRFCKMVPPRCSLLPTKAVYIKSPRKTAIDLSVACLSDGRGRVGLVLVLPGCGRTAVHAVEFRGGVRGRRVPRGDGVMPVPAVVGCCLAPWRRRPLPDVRASAATWPVAPPTVVGRGGDIGRYLACDGAARCWGLMAPGRVSFAPPARGAGTMKDGHAPPLPVRACDWQV